MDGLRPEHSTERVESWAGEEIEAETIEGASMTDTPSITPEQFHQTHVDHIAQLAAFWGA